MPVTDGREILSILLDFKGERIREYCGRRIGEGADPHDIFGELSAGLEEIGRGFEGAGTTRYFTSDLIVSGRNMKRALAILRPHFSPGGEKSFSPGGEKSFPRSGRGKGLVVLGTVKGDVHDIGKMIFAVTLESNGFSCIDLGVDVDREVFADAVARHRPDILSLSALLTSTLPAMREVLEELERRGLRQQVKVIVGGHPVTGEFAREIGADAWGRDAVDGLKKCLSFTGAGP
ncbi:MAG TPA: cobalamin-dependent protein [Methanomicrobiales archaeon]|jgi:5-methyltetrahydrofolate--homocysteine methyltransferase|nr:cobalamin-dependent protein [Methanomicrobiales archaeon]